MVESPEELVLGVERVKRVLFQLVVAEKWVLFTSIRDGDGALVPGTGYRPGFAIGTPLKEWGGGVGTGAEWEPEKSILKSIRFSTSESDNTLPEESDTSSDDNWTGKRTVAGGGNTG